MVTKTISTKAAKVPTPNMFEHKVHKYFLNTELWTELEPEQWIKYEYPKIREACNKVKMPLVVSMGYTAEEVAEMAPKVAQFADAIELSTHYISDDPKPMQDAIKAAINGSGGKPVLVKLSPFRDAHKAALAAEQAGASGIVAVNSFGPTLALDIERLGRSVMGSTTKYGWVSGPALKPLAMRVVYDVCKTVKIPVIGVGGCSTGTDAIEFLMAGASGVGICTSAIVSGREAFSRITGEMIDWMTQHNIKDVNQLVGLAHKQDNTKQTKPPKVIEENCVGCSQCEISCCYDAIKVIDAVARVNAEKCFKCGLCYSRCPNKAITIDE